MSLLLLRRGDGWWAVLHWWEMLLYCGTVGVSEHTRPFLGSSSALTLMKGKNNFSNLCNCISFKFRQVHHRQASELSSMLFLTVSLMCWVWVFVIVSSEYSEVTDYFYMQRKKYTTARVVRVLKQSDIVYCSMRWITHWFAVRHLVILMPMHHHNIILFLLG